MGLFAIRPGLPFMVSALLMAISTLCLQMLKDPTGTDSDWMEELPSPLESLPTADPGAARPMLWQVDLQGGKLKPCLGRSLSHEPRPSLLEPLQAPQLFRHSSA